MAKTSAPVDPRLAAVILAAGGSRRLGYPKQLLRCRGTTLIERAAHLARGAAGNVVVVVLGDQRQRIRSMLRRRATSGTRVARLTIVANARWADGLATSLRAGIEALPATAKAVLILLVDQARIEPHDIGRLTTEWRKRPSLPAAAHYLGRAGVPAVIPRRWFRQLASLTGDVGAREVLRRLTHVTLVAMPSAEFDVDIGADAAALDR